MDSGDLFKVVPDSEDPGYVRLRDDPVSHQQDADKRSRRSSTIPVPSAAVSKLRISLSQEQLKINKSPSESTQKPTPILPNKNKHHRRVSLQSPMKQQTRFPYAPHKSITAKEATNWSSKIVCKLCDKPLTDPRVLVCLHTFCLACLQKRLDSDSDVFHTEKSSTNSSSQSGELPVLLPPPSRSFSIASASRRASQKSFSSITSATKSRPLFHSAIRHPICPTCGATTHLPIGGLSRLPKHTILNRLIGSHGSQRCRNCDNCNHPESVAVHNCLECSVNLCAACSEVHKKQRIGSGHTVEKLEPDKTQSEDSGKASERRCSFHPNSDLKLFCTNCNQVVCSECVVALHNGHKCESIHKAIKVYSKLLNDSIHRVRPSTDYATLTISKLVAINKKIDKKCDAVRQQVEGHLYDYQKALDHHRNTLFSQVQRAREMKVAAIATQTADLEKRSSEAKTAIEFAEMILANGSDLEIMSFIGVVLKRFEYCEKSKVPLDANVNDSLRFLPEIRAPSTAAQISIPLFGIITTQTADPNLCSIEGQGLSNLKVNRRVEITLIARDRDNKQLCHGGLKLHVELKYADFGGRTLEHQTSDKRDGTYQIAFTPDAAGTIRLSACIAGKPIRDNPFLVTARNLNPHSGIYHCCTFCSTSSGGHKPSITCACGGTMEGFSGCGHGHPGHPGRRHWSCCGNILENSECLTANEFEY